MIDYPDWTDDALVAEVARRMGSPCRASADNQVEIQNSYNFEWQPIRPAKRRNEMCRLIEDVKRDIQERGYDWESGCTYIGGRPTYDAVIVDRGTGDDLWGALLMPTQARAWLIAYLRATDEQRD
jgi:hypothetical protein